jgi:Undecaprenyl-phosphate galactose phosphotransferase WbaP
MWRLQLSTQMSEKASAVSAVASPQVSAAQWEVPGALWWPRVVRVAVLLLTDMMALLSGVSLGYFLWAWPVLRQPASAYLDLIPLLFLFPLGYAGAGLYPGFGLGAVETLRRLSCCTSFAFLLVIAVGFVLKLPTNHSRMAFAIAWGASLIFLPLSRFMVLSVVSRYRWWGEPTVLVGSGRWAQWAIRSLADALSLGYRPLGLLSPDHRWHGRAIEGVPVLGGPEMAPYLAKCGVRVALMEEDKSASSGLTLSWLQRYFQHVVLIQKDQDLPVERVRVCNLGAVLGIECTNSLLHWHNRFIKRTLDVVLGAIFLVLASPLIALGGLLVKLSSHGPGFYCQEREGLEASHFRVWKLRTMYQDAEKRLEEFLSVNPELRREWEERLKLARDPRVVFGVGVFLRRFSIDELPQLWNVVKGEMSLVGPRPFPEYHLQRFPPEFRELRRRVRPGLTGMWQVMVRSNGSIEAQQIYDLYYIRNWSIWLDLWILARTIGAVLATRGAY